MSVIYQPPFNFYPECKDGKCHTKLGRSEPTKVFVSSSPQNTGRYGTYNPTGSGRYGTYEQVGSGSDYLGQFHAVPMDNRTLSAVTSKYIDRSPMFNPLKKNTIIPTIYDGIVPTGAYLMGRLPTTPAYNKYNNDPISETDLHCQCQKNGVRLYDEIEGKLVPRNKHVLLHKLMMK